MPNTREKLIELLEQINGCCPNEDDCYHCKYEALDDCSVYAKADFLIANGVTIPVRCKDCGHYHENVCPIWCYTETKPDDFCSYGERRNDV